MAVQQKSTTKPASAQVAKIASVLSAKDLGVTVRSGVSSAGFATWVRSLLQGWRQGTVGCKGRSDVKASTRKPWKQKGTGRARAGTARSPLWRGGGVIFGPQARIKKIKVPRKVKRGVKNSLFWSCVDQKKLISLDWTGGERPKSADAVAALKKAGLANKPVVLFVTSGDMITRASFANVPNVNLVLMDEVNAFNLTRGQYWVVLKKDLDSFKQVVAQWV